MSKTEIVFFRKANFRVEVQLEDLDPNLAAVFASMIYRARPSRLDNMLEIEVLHRADIEVPRIIQHVCERGIKTLTLHTVYPVAASKITADPRCYMKFEYRDGHVHDQWSEMSHHEDEADDLMIDMLKIGFSHKMVTDCIWRDDLPTPLTIVAGRDHQARR